MKQRILMLITIMVCANSTIAFAQKSVAVPQILQKDVHAFKLTIDSLNVLSQDLHNKANAVLKDLQIIQEKKTLLTPGSRSYLLEKRRYEEKLSEYMAQKYSTLQEMQTLRLNTLASLDKIVDNLKDTRNVDSDALQNGIEEQIRLNKDRMTTIRLQMVRILDELKKKELSPELRSQLNKKFYQLRHERLALYDQYAQRLSQLLRSARRQNDELPAVLGALSVMQETLRDGFDWIESEMAYISLYAEHRQSRIAIDEKLLEVVDLVDRFNEFIEELNQSSTLLRQVEGFAEDSNTMTNGASLLPKISPLKWPGQPQSTGGGALLSEAQIDSLRDELRKQLKQ